MDLNGSKAPVSKGVATIKKKTNAKGRLLNPTGLRNSTVHESISQPSSSFKSDPAVRALFVAMKRLIRTGGYWHWDLIHLSVAEVNEMQAVVDRKETPEKLVPTRI